MAHMYISSPPLECTLSLSPSPLECTLSLSLSQQSPCPLRALAHDHLGRTGGKAL